MAAVLAGTLITGGVTLAASHYVKALIGPSQIQVNGKVVAKAPKLMYGGKVYVQLQAVQKAMSQALGKQPTWKNGRLNIVVPAPSKGSGGSGSGSGSGSGAVNVSQLPYTVQYSDGMKLTITSVTASATSTVIDVTIANAGPEPDGAPALSFYGSSLSDGGPAINLLSDADNNLSSPNSSAYNDLHPGQSVQDVLTFGPLSAGATSFTWYFQDFDLNTHDLTFNLNS